MKKKHWFVFYDISFALVLAASVFNRYGQKLFGTICRIIALTIFVVARIQYAKRFEEETKLAVFHILGWFISITAIELRHRVDGSTLDVFMLISGVSLVLYARYKANKRDQVASPTWSKVILVALAVVVMILPIMTSFYTLFPSSPQLAGESPFDHIYRVESVLKSSETNTYSDNTPLVHLYYNNELYFIWDNSSFMYEEVGVFEYVKPNSEAEQTDRDEVWKLTPEGSPEQSYELSLKSDGNVVLTHYIDEVVDWRFLLRRVDTLTCSVRSSAELSSPVPDWYASGTFQGGLENLSFARVKGEGEITLWFRGDPVDTICIVEEYYADDTVQIEEYTLQGDSDGRFILPIEARGQQGKQYAIYRVPYESGEYIFGVNFLP